MKDFSYFSYIITQRPIFVRGTPYIGEWSHHSQRFFIQAISVKGLPVIHWLTTSRPDCKMKGKMWAEIYLVIVIGHYLHYIPVKYIDTFFI